MRAALQHRDQVNAKVMKGPRILFAITVNGGILAGRWQFPDKNPVEIVDVGDGRFLGEYRGTAASGHPNLMGRFFGAFDGARWTGDFTIDEEALAVTGTFALDYAPGPPETLAGTITAHSNLDPVDRTNPITLTRAKSKRR